MHVVDAEKHIYDLSEDFCEWCFAGSNDFYVTRCPACNRYTCRECVHLFADGMACEHTTPEERRVLTRSDWDDD